MSGSAYAQNLLIAADTRGMSREEWLRIRRLGIGGSDASAVAGLNRYRSPLSVYLDKIGAAPEVEENEPMYWGTVLEDIVADEFAKRTGLKVRRRNAILRHRDHPHMLANIDRMIVKSDEGLECKTASAYKASEWENGEVPWEYAIQCHHYMAVTGFSAWWIAVLIGGNKFEFKRIERDEEIISHLVKIETDFWNDHVLTQSPPLPDGSSPTAELLKSMYPQSNGIEIPLPSEVGSLVEQYELAKAEEDAACERKDEAANRLKQLLGENEIGRFNDIKIVWKTITSNRIDSKKLKVDHPDIYQAFAKPSTSRRFEIKREVQE